MDVIPLGIGGFIFAYLCLICAYQKNFKIGGAEIITAIPILLVYLYVFVYLKPYVKGFIFIESIIFGIVLCYMTWSAVCTVFRGYFRKKIALIIDISGSLMFICDMGVAFSLFHPYYSQVFVPWLNTIIWGSYIPGWTLLAVVISERRLRMNA